MKVIQEYYYYNPAFLKFSCFSSYQHIPFFLMAFHVSIGAKASNPFHMQCIWWVLNARFTPFPSFWAFVRFPFFWVRWACQARVSMPSLSQVLFLHGNAERFLQKPFQAGYREAIKKKLVLPSLLNEVCQGRKKALLSGVVAVQPRTPPPK